MARDRVTRLGEKLISHRERTPFAEVDLLLSSIDQIILIEVKTVTKNWDRSFFTSRQFSRLSSARFHLEEEFSRPAVLLVALVSLESRTIRYVDPSN